MHELENNERTTELYWCYIGRHTITIIICVLRIGPDGDRAMLSARISTQSAFFHLSGMPHH